MPLSGRKKFLLFLAGILLIIVAAFAIFIFFYENDEGRRLARSVDAKAAAYPNYINKTLIHSSLSTVNNKKLDEKTRYKALVNITFYFSDAYYGLHDPTVRKFVASLDPFAKKNFPKYYQPGDFALACSDPECGEGITPEIEKILVNVQNIAVDNIYRDVITRNITTAAYIPNDTDLHKDDKFNTFQVAYSQLIDLKDPQASASAAELKQYVKTRYNRDL